VPKRVIKSWFLYAPIEIGGFLKGVVFAVGVAGCSIGCVC